MEDRPDTRGSRRRRRGLPRNRSPLRRRHPGRTGRVHRRVCSVVRRDTDVHLDDDDLSVVCRELGDLTREEGRGSVTSFDSSPLPRLGLGKRVQGRQTTHDQSQVTGGYGLCRRPFRRTRVEDSQDYDCRSPRSGRGPPRTSDTIR